MGNISIYNSIAWITRTQIPIVLKLELERAPKYNLCSLAIHHSGSSNSDAIKTVGQKGERKIPLKISN
jgi:hypothetical protein